MRSLPAPVTFEEELAAREIRPQARVLAVGRGIRCVTLGYDRMRGMEPENTLF